LLDIALWLSVMPTINPISIAPIIFVISVRTEKSDLSGIRL